MIPGRGLITIGPGFAHLLGRIGVVLALVAAAALGIATVTIGIPADPEGAGLGSLISSPVQLTLAALMGLAGLLALRWQAAAALLMAVAATGLGLFASIQYVPALSVGLTAALLVPAVATWLAWQRNETTGGILALAALTAIVLIVTAIGSREVYAYYFGPTHPESSRDAAEWVEADWLWVGGVTDTDAVVVAGGLESGRQYRIWLDRTVNGPERTASDAVAADEYGIARFELSDLEPDSEYRYVVAGAPADGLWDSSFRTHASGPHDLRVVLSSCARVGSNGAVFDAMIAEDPDLFLALGDLHYANLESTDPADHVAAYGRALSQPAQAALFSAVPTAYVWDDHDYGPNDSDGTSPSRPAVSEAYRRAVPHHGVDSDPRQSIAQAFTVGRVRFVVTDTRSMRTGSTMLGADQLDWFLGEVSSSASSHALVVWLNPTPWISSAGPGSDDWSGFSTERRRIADHVAAEGIANLVMVSGDAHMVALDDGSNSGYAADGSAGFPVLHAAALDRPGSEKGGPYSHGAFPGGGQYGRLEVEDDGGATVRVRLSGHTWEGLELTALELEIEVPDGAT